MNKTKKALLFAVACLLIAGAYTTLWRVNADRERFGITRITPLQNAPPVLAFTTVALGGFRGLIANLLWIRATELQDQDKYFEMVQLADWITKLEPRFPHVWAVQAWNMTYNISIKFKDFEDRWRWVYRGIELLRDYGIQYNPTELMLYKELAWFFLHKLGQDLDDAHFYYKQRWAKIMEEVIKDPRPNFDELIDPQTDEARKRSRVLREHLKMDPVVMKQSDQQFGPLEWRLPEASAIYWAYLGLQIATNYPHKVKREDLIHLRRIIYQSMQLSFRRGKLITDPVTGEFLYGPNLDIIPKVNETYETMVNEVESDSDKWVIKRAQRNFLRDAIYFLYVHNRISEAQQWFYYVAQMFPTNNMISGDTNSLPSQITLDQYAVARIQEDIGETSHDRVKAIIMGLLRDSFLDLILGQHDRAEGLHRLAIQLYTRFQTAVQPAGERVALPPFNDLRQAVLNELLDPEKGLLPEYKARLITELGLPPDILTNQPASINQPTSK